MKKLAFIFLTILSLVLVACVPQQSTELDTLLSQIELNYATNDSSISVTNNFSLPTSIGEATITWESSDTSVIAIVGSTAQVTRGATDVNVTLTAEITLNGETKDKPFVLTVKALVITETYYTITWNIDGVLSTTTVLENTLPSHEEPTKEGYTFIGWNPSIVNATADTTYTALFELIVVETNYTITWNIEGVLSTTTVLENTLPSHEEPTKEGYTFIGWNPSIVNATADTTYTAVFELIVVETYYTITWNIDGVLSTTSVLENTLPSHTDPEKEGYVFVGWSPAVVNATADTTYTALFELEEPQPAELDGAALDALLGASIYQLLPAIFTADYDMVDDSSTEYPVDIYIDLFDWVEADYLAFEAALSSSLTFDDAEGSYVVGEFFMYIYLEEELYDVPVYSINIYNYPDSGTDPDTTFNGAALDALLGASIYDLLPPILTHDYEMFDESSEEFPVDIYIDLYDFDEADYFVYESALSGSLTLDPIQEAYVVGNFFIYIYLEEEVYDVPVYSINIYSYQDSGTDPDPDPVVDGEVVVTSKYDALNNVSVADGDISSHLTFVSGGPTMTVSFAKNDSTVSTLFNNNYSEIRLYSGNGNGGKLTFDIESGYQITGVSVLIGSNNVGLSINGGAANTTKNGVIEVNFPSPVETVELKNIVQAGSGNVAIVSVTFYYVGGEPQTIETWSEAITQLETQLSLSALDELFPEIMGLSSFSVTSVGNGALLSATPDNADGATIINGYITTLLSEGWVLDALLSTEVDVYVYEINSNVALMLILEGDSESISLYVEKFNPNLGDGNLDTLTSVESITDMELEKFGKSGLPSSGTYDVLVIPIEIKGSPFPMDYLTKLDLVFNGNEVETGWESVSSYYQQSSYGQLNLNFDIANKYITSQNKAFYDDNPDGDMDIIDEALPALEGIIDFAQYDYNNDGVIDSILFVYSVDYNYDVDPWWAWVYTMQSTIEVDGKDVEYYMWASYDFMMDSIPGNSELVLNAETYIHELGHLLGIPDLYSQTHDYGPLGGWDMMDFNVGDHGPANKLMFGWLKPLIAEVGNYQVTLDSFTLDTDGMNSALLIPYNSSDLSDGDAFDEYLLVVFYTPGGLYNAHYNTTISVEDAGVVIYHVDARLNSNFGFWGEYFINNNNDSSNFLVDLLEVDGNASLPTSVTDGYIKPADLLTSGSVNFKNLYDWHQGGDIDVVISIASSFNNDSESVTLTVTIN